MVSIKVTLALAVLLFCLFKPCSALTMAGENGGGVGRDLRERPRAIVLILDKITWEDLFTRAGPKLTSLLEKSGVALMNVNTAGAPATEGGYLTIGAGARLTGNWTARRAFQAEEEPGGHPARALYRMHTGRQDLPAGNVLHPYAVTLKELNMGLPYPFFVGTLGEALKAKGQKAAVLGNADTDNYGRQAVTIAMDAQGVVKLGDVGLNLTRDNEEFPFGFSSDPEAYLEAFQKVYAQASLIVIEWGDTSRIDAYLPHLPAERRGELLGASFRELDVFLKGIAPYLVSGTRLFILTPSPAHPSFTGGQRLTPLILYDPSFPGEGLLVSATTRRPGIVTNIDIVPSVLEHLKLLPPVFLWGSPLEVVPQEGHLKRIEAISRQTALIYMQRPPLIKGYILSQIILLLGGLAVLLFRFKPLRKMDHCFYVILLFPLAVFLAAAFPFFPAGSVLQNALLILSVTALLSFFSLKTLKSSHGFFAFTSLLFFSLLTLDLVRGAVLNSRSYLGYDPISGARFYGLGNEYMGFLVGTFILGFSSLFSPELLDRARPDRHGLPKRGIGFRIFAPALVFWFFALLALLLLYFMASPLFGANLGGTVTLGVAVAISLSGTYSLFREKSYPLLPFPREGEKENPPPDFTPSPGKGRGKKGLKNPPLEILFAGYLENLKDFRILLFFFFFLAGVFFLYYLNVPSSGEVVSHLGRTWDLVLNSGSGELGNVVLRKIGMNMKLVRFSLWSRVLLIFLVLMVILYFYPAGLMKKIFSLNPGFKIALGGIIAASVTSFLVNDSGVVAAACILLYGAVPLLLLSWREIFG